MKNYFIIASANSRLQADIILIRLRQAKISCRKISVLYPTESLPNGVGCWLPVSTTGDLKASGQPVSRAGQIVKQRVTSTEAHDDGREIIELLLKAGIDRSGAQILAERLSQGHILLGVHAASETERSIVWHVLYHSCADTIVVGHGVGDQPEGPPTEWQPDEAEIAAVAH
jgi:hypothetical protein